jgi:Leucine-rich repeat (LRR) protein
LTGVPPTAFHRAVMAWKTLVVVSLLALAPGCHHPSSGDAGDGAAASASAAEAASTPVPATSGSAGADDDESTECEGEVCKVTEIDDKTKSDLEAEPGYRFKRIRFADSTTNEQLKTITQIPWVTKLDLDGCKEISDLSPLAELHALKDVSLEGDDQVVDLTPLAGLADLERLILAKTSVTSLAAIKGMPKLARLDASGTKVTELGPISAATKLIHLSLTDVQAKDWWALQKLAAVTQLDLSRSNIASAMFLSGMKEMKKLTLQHCAQLKDITGLRFMTQMETLRLDDTPITSVQALATMLDLQVVSLAGTKIGTIAPLSSLSDLRSIDLQRTAVTDFDPLSASAKSLHYLGLPKGTTSEQYDALKDENPKIHPDIAKKR